MNTYTPSKQPVLLRSIEPGQFRSRAFVSELNRHGLQGSMGRVGACGDNAAMESFFALVQKNVLDRQRWATRDELRLAIITWIEKTYHRRQRRLGRLTPIEFETILTTTANAA
jgi:transposase InsO family protein